MQKQRLTDLLLCIVSVELVGALSGIVAGGSFGAVYHSFDRPPFAPPGWVFPVAWGILYALMGLTLFWLLESKHPGKRQALLAFGVQLAVNFVWSPVFFGLQALLTAVVLILVLTGLVGWMCWLCFRVKPLSGWLDLPYLLWCAYASYLTIGIYVLN